MALPSPLPPLLDLLEVLRAWVLLEGVQNADFYLACLVVFLTLLLLVQRSAFTRPPPVPSKVLPRRPGLQILFKPEDVRSPPDGPPPSSSTSSTVESPFPTTVGGVGGDGTTGASSTTPSAAPPPSGGGGGGGGGGCFPPSVVFPPPPPPPPSSPSSRGGGAGGCGGGGGGSISTPVPEDGDGGSSSAAPPRSPSGSATSGNFLRHVSDLLPDSFAPLLSSSRNEVVLNQLTPDLIHGLRCKGTLWLREGHHTVPLNKDKSRPQLMASVTQKSSVTATVSVGSSGFSAEEDLDVTKPTASRSLTMVKEAQLTFDPPIALSNVAPTLIHLPSLFVDNAIPALRRIRGIGFALDVLASISACIERFLWLVESKCRIHLGRVRVAPQFHGGAAHANWRLNLSFSGHVVLFGWVRIPFISVRLPTFIIPAPHAFLRNLLTPQPLASATLRRENLAEERIVLALLDACESWSADATLVGTPPAFSVDVTLPGGMTVAVETMLGRDVGAAAAGGGMRTMEGVAASEMMSLSESHIRASESFAEQQSVSSWNSVGDGGGNPRSGRPHAGSIPSSPSMNGYQMPPTTQKAFDANVMVPWSVDVRMNGSIDRDRVAVTLSRASATHYSVDASCGDDKAPTHRKTSQVTLSGSCVVYRADPGSVPLEIVGGGYKLTPKRQRNLSCSNLDDLVNGTDGLPSVYSTLLFPDFITSTTKSQRKKQLMQYDYSFDIEEDSTIDAVSISAGASHPMLKGATIVTTVLESIYASGSLTAREGAILNPFSRARKRNFLRHLPAIDFSCGVQNAFIPEESMSYHDDGQTRVVPKLRGGRMTVRITGGFTEDSPHSDLSSTLGSSHGDASHAIEGIKLIADFALSSLSLENETYVREFPELEIFDGSKLSSIISGACSGRILSHLRPQDLHSHSNDSRAHVSSTGPNIFNPLEAYEIDFAGSSVSVKLREWTATLGHRRLIIPSETTCWLRVLESVVDMSFEGKTRCECSWDFQGLSPMLQVTSIGHTPADATHEEKHQVPLLIPDLRQGKLNFNVSPVGGITITQAVTSRQNREGLYDWKFFNALVSPDDESPERLMQVLHDKRTMRKLLQVVKLINAELEQILSHILTQVWRAKEIFDQEGITDPGHAIPGHKMARLVSLFLCGDLSRVDDILPIIRRATDGDGLDEMKVKELLHEHVRAYDDWASEIDRAVRWVSVLLGPMSAQPPYVDMNVPPLCELPEYASRFTGIPSAKELYDSVHHERHLPLDPSFSNLVGRVAPYMSFHQVEYILRTRSFPRDWEADDLRRLRYVFAVKKKVLDISESYGGLTFLPQSFFVSVFLGEATRASLRARDGSQPGEKDKQAYAPWPNKVGAQEGKASTLSGLRRTRMSYRSSRHTHTTPHSLNEDDFVISPAGRVASKHNLQELQANGIHRVPPPKKSYRGQYPSYTESVSFGGSTYDGLEPYQLGDSLLGPQDVAILLQAGLTSAMKGSTVVQLNQRMLLDLIASQPKQFAVAVLAEIGTPGGHGSPRGLSSALMALLEMDQSSFKEAHRLDMHRLLETWLPGYKMPRRDDYLAGGRWARQSYYEAIFAVAKNILEDAEPYMALKGHIQRVRHGTERDPIPRAKEIELSAKIAETHSSSHSDIVDDMAASKLFVAIENAKKLIAEADEEGAKILPDLLKAKLDSKSKECQGVVTSYRNAFVACSAVLKMDKLAFQADWFKSFFRRNYDALMVKSLYDNAIDDVDRVRIWLDALRNGSRRAEQKKRHAMIAEQIQLRQQMVKKTVTAVETDGTNKCTAQEVPSGEIQKDVELLDESSLAAIATEGELYFQNVEDHAEQEVVDSIVDCIFYDEGEKEKIRKDPLARLLISNPPGKYNFTIVLAMGVVTEGKHGLELASALDRLKESRGVESIRSDTGTARSLEFNASRIEDAIKTAVHLQKPFGFLGYSQGCANCLTSEALFLSGSPVQQDILTSPQVGLVCRQLLFSAANGSIHGPAADTKIQKLIVMCEQTLKYQQGYFSREFISAALGALNEVMDSAAFHKFIGGAHSFLPEGLRACWREGQFVPHVPTTVLRGVEEEHTTPESLEMMSNLLTKQSGSPQHDSQVHVYDAVGHPVYTKNRNGQILSACDMGGAIQRTHHWSPLDKEVEFVRTKRDMDQASFDCAKDRHVFPWVDVNARFGVIKYVEEEK